MALSTTVRARVETRGRLNLIFANAAVGDWGPERNESSARLTTRRLPEKMARDADSFFRDIFRDADDVREGRASTFARLERRAWHSRLVSSRLDSTRLNSTRYRDVCKKKRLTVSKSCDQMRVSFSLIFISLLRETLSCRW